MRIKILSSNIEDKLVKTIEEYFPEIKFVDDGQDVLVIVIDDGKMAVDSLITLETFSDLCMNEIDVNNKTDKRVIFYNPDKSLSFLGDVYLLEYEKFCLTLHDLLLAIRDICPAYMQSFLEDPEDYLVYNS